MGRSPLNPIATHQTDRTPPMDFDYRSLIAPERIHGKLYKDPEIFRQEMQAIFHHGWVFVGHESEVPRTGSFVSKPLGLQNVIMVRAEDGAVHVLYDRCPHRGNKVLQQSEGVARGFVCAYHSWSFGLDGSFKAMPDASGCGPDFDFRSARLAALPRVQSWRGFVFASMQAEGISLAAHLGRAAAMIDQLVDLSPAGQVRLSAGWLRHRIRGNWKSLLENQVDGYHAPFVHSSLLTANRDWADERDRRGDSPTTTRDLGMGHSEVDYSDGYRAKGTTLRWTGNIPEARAPRYVAAMRAAYPAETAQERLVAGPPHAAIFPNLFIAEMNIMVLQPLGPDETIQWTTPVLLEEGHEINERTLRRCEGALGPAGFLIADDSEIAELNQRGLRNDVPEWLLLGRGLHDETHQPDGTIVGGLMDETSQRAFWRHYAGVMSGGQAS